MNNEGVPRHLLLVTLRDRRKVATARRVDLCLLCLRSRVNESGLCDYCYGLIDGEEFEAAQRWLSGVGP